MAEFQAGPKNGSGALRGYVPWAPHHKTRIIVDQIIEVIEEYSEHLPLTVRQIFYRLVGAYGYEKTENAYNRIIYYIGRARRARIIDFDWIRDDGAVVYSPRFYDGPAAFWDHVGGLIRKYRGDRQAGQAQYVELWCEASGMAPQLARVADRYSVPVFSSSGFDSLTIKKMVANRACDRLVPTVLMHVGDFDPWGESIFAAVLEDAAAFVEAERAIQTLFIKPVRVALTAEQVRAHELPTSPFKKPTTKQLEAVQAGRRAKHGNLICQAEALAPDVLMAIVDEAIAAYFDPNELEARIDDERAAQAVLYKGLPPGTKEEDK